MREHTFPDGRNIELAVVSKLYGDLSRSTGLYGIEWLVFPMAPGQKRLVRIQN